MNKCSSPHAAYYIFGNGFLDAFFPWFPPSEILLLPICTEQPNRWFFMSIIAVLGASCGASIIYIFGGYFTGVIDELLAQIPSEKFEKELVRDFLDRWGLIAIYFLGVLPVPILITSFMAGSQEINYFIFIFALSLARATRYVPFSFIVARFNIQLDKLLRKHLFTLVLFTFVIFFSIIYIANSFL